MLTVVASLRRHQGISSLTKRPSRKEFIVQSAYELHADKIDA